MFNIPCIARNAAKESYKFERKKYLYISSLHKGFIYLFDYLFIYLFYLAGHIAIFCSSLLDLRRDKGIMHFYTYF